MQSKSMTRDTKLDFQNPTWFACRVVEQQQPLLPLLSHFVALPKGQKMAV